jgi:lysyl-tRNA synthetase class 2
MATLKDFRDERLRKLAELKQLGVNPYPSKASRTKPVSEITDKFDELQGKQVSVVGRIKSIRKFGSIAFIVIKDESGEVQLFWRQLENASADRTQSELLLEDIRLLDTSDFIEASGPVIKTQTGEISIEIQTLRMLTKALRPLPSEQEGFTNKEERMRRRYVDMAVNKAVHDRFVRRSKFWQATRDFMNENGFLEVNIPVLEHTTGGADANPFVTHMDALDQDFYLRISHELPLKRLLGGGFEKVYDIGPRFRNENYSDEHLPEHVAMEWYWAFADWEQGMALMEEMFRYVLQKTYGKLQFNIDGMEVDMGKNWEKWDYAGVIRDHYGLDVFNSTIEEVKNKLQENGLEVEKTENIARGIDKLWKKIRSAVTGPVWLINTPAFISPLSKSDDQDPRIVQRFQAVIAGSELSNGFSELNDPVDQLNRFKEQQQMRDAGDDEAMMLDIDYIEMLEYGMPPACGLGYSERVFWVFEGVSAREGVPFPQLKSEIDEVTKSIYPEVFGNKDLPSS